MAKVTPSRDEGQLLVAAIRVRAHLDGRPPLLDQVADLLGMPHELMRVLAIGLEDKGVLKMLTNAFEVRLDIVNPALIDELPPAGSGPRLGSELDDFRKAFQTKQDDLKKTFGKDVMKKKADEKLSAMEEKLRQFKQKPQTPMFGMLSDLPPDDDE